MIPLRFMDFLVRFWCALCATVCEGASMAEAPTPTPWHRFVSGGIVAATIRRTPYIYIYRSRVPCSRFDQTAGFCCGVRYSSSCGTHFRVPSALCTVPEPQNAHSQARTGDRAIARPNRTTKLSLFPKLHSGHRAAACRRCLSGVAAAQ